MPKDRNFCHSWLQIWGKTTMHPSPFFSITIPHKGQLDFCISRVPVDTDFHGFHHPCCARNSGILKLRAAPNPGPAPMKNSEDLMEALFKACAQCFPEDCGTDSKALHPDTDGVVLSKDRSFCHQSKGFWPLQVADPHRLLSGAPASFHPDTDGLGLLKDRSFCLSCWQTF